MDMNTFGDDSNTPLILSIKNKRVDIIKYMLQLPQVDINKCSKKYGHPLHMAIQCQEYKLASKLLKQKNPLKQLDINSRNEDGNNALHYLFLNYHQNPQNSKELAKILIKRGINVNQLNKNKLSPLHLAIVNNQIDAIAFALKYNKHVRKSKIGQYISPNF